ncbi:MAG: FkbM family methyltransferase [Turicibacter sp.]|nr:FkbM family methyltransferase [Turicibacter sp.]
MEKLLMDAYENFAKIYASLADEESKLLYRANLAFCLSGQETFFEMVYDLDKQKDFGWNELMDNFDGKSKIVIFGCGGSGVFIYNSLRSMGYEVEAFSDNNAALWGTSKANVPIISPTELAERYADAFIIVAIWKMERCLEIKEQLIGLKCTNIYIPKYTGMILNLSKSQYFDDEILQPLDNEIFIDAGAFDGQTSVDFVNWCKRHNKSPKKSYVIEPTAEGIAKAYETVRASGFSDILQVVEGGVAEKTGVLRFDSSAYDRGSSAISEVGEDRIKVYAIDDLLDGSPATFIKMDIEGAELSALKGAAETIRRHKPRLAICCYHKKDDLIILPHYIRQLHSGYKFYLRKYTPHSGELVLYAV